MQDCYCEVLNRFVVYLGRLIGYWRFSEGGGTTATDLASGYDGPVGILGHRADEDVAVSLQNNLTGLDRLLKELLGP